MAYGPLHPAGGGVVSLGNLWIEHLGDGVDDVHILHRDHNGLTDILITLDMGRYAHLVDNGGHKLLQARSVELLLVLLRQADEVLNHCRFVIRLAQEHGRAQIARLRYHLLGNKVGDRQDLGPFLAVQAAQNPQPVHTRQDQIQHQHVRLCVGNHLQYLIAVAGRADDCKTSRFLQGVLQHTAGVLVYVRQHDFYSVVHTRVSFQ